MNYLTRAMTAARPDREPITLDAVGKLRRSRPVDVERELREEYGVPPLLARSVVQEAAKRLRREGGEIYRDVQATRTPGSRGCFHVPRHGEDNATDD